MNEKQKIIRKIGNALNANDYESARKIIERDLKRCGINYEYYFYLALVSEDLVKKLELYNQAIDLNPSFLDGYINRGLVKNELQDYEGSIEDYNKAIELDPNCALCFNNRGYTKFKQKDYEGALKDYNKAILLNPDFKMALDNKANLFQEVCLEDDKDFSEKFYLSLGIKETRNGNFLEALKNFDEVLKYNKNSAIAYFYKGVSYHSMGNEDLAVENYSISIEKDKKMIDAYFNRGQILMKAQPKKALDDFASAIALDPKFLDAYYSVAVIQRKLGQLEEAVKNLDKIIELETNAVNAKALKKLILKKGKG